MFMLEYILLLFGRGGELKLYLNIFIINCNKFRKNIYIFNKDKKEFFGNFYFY